MMFNLDNANSSEHQLQPNSLVLHLPSSLVLERPLVIHLSCQTQKEKAEAEGASSFGRFTLSGKM